MSEAWIEEAINDSELTCFTKENAEHYMKVRTYLFGCLQMHFKNTKGRESVDVYTDLIAQLIF